MPIKLISGAGGSLTVQPASTASNYTLTVPAVTANVITSGDVGTITQTMIGSNVVGKAIAFRAYLSTNQSVTTGGAAKVNIDTKVFDTNTFFDTTNYWFKPTIAGYYQLNAFTYWASPYVTTGNVYIGITNGNDTSKNIAGPNLLSAIALGASGIMYMNGSTDYAYVEVGHNQGATRTLTGGSSPILTSFSGILVGV